MTEPSRLQILIRENTLSQGLTSDKILRLLFTKVRGELQTGFGLRGGRKSLRLVQMHFNFL